MRQSRLYTAEGIVIRRTNTGEADRIVTLFAKRHGKLKAIAKGVRKVPSRRAGHLEVFSHVRVGLYRGKTFDIVTEASQLSPSITARVQLTSLSHSYYAAELIDRLIPENLEHDEIFDLFRKTLQDIAESTSDRACGTYLQEFALELLWQLGFLPRSIRPQEHALDEYIESVVERRMKSRMLLTRFRNTA